MTPLELAAVPLVGALGAAALKAAFILSLAAITTMALRRRSAALKHLVWTISLAMTMAVLILPIIVPAWPVVQVPAASAFAPVATSAPAGPVRNLVPLSFSSPEHLHGTWPERPIQSDTPSAIASIAAHWPSAVVGLWLTGVLVVLGRFAWSSIVLHRLLQRADSLHATDCGALAARIAADMRIARPVSLLVSDDVELPLTWGILRPRVVLPGDASEWSKDRCCFVLQHELAHVGRLDAATQLVAQAASAVFWFHPLVWYASRQMRHERERACDDRVLAHGALASAYADDLLALVRTYGHIERHPVALAMARRSQFEGRLLALLDPTVDRGLPSLRSLTLVLSLGACLAVPLAAMQSAQTIPVSPEARDQVVPTPPVPPAPPAVLARGSRILPVPPAPSVPLVQAPPVPRTPATPQVRPSAPIAGDDLFAGCVSNGSSHSSNHSDSDNGASNWTASAQVGDCSFELKSEGQVLFSRGFAAIDRISDGGFLDVTTRLHGEVTRLLARGSSSGAVTYEFNRGGQRLDFKGDGDAWLKRFLITLDRLTAFAIDRRLPLLLQTGGPAAVLDETDRMRTDHAQAMYLLRLTDQAALDPDALRRAYALAVAMAPGHNAAEVLVGLANRYGLPTAAIADEFLKGALASGPDHDQTRILMSYLERASPDTRQSLAILTSVRAMTVEHEKCRVLLALAGKGPLDPAVRDAYMRTAGTLQLDFERSRALAAIARR